MRAAEALYLANASVLLTHQIDAAYWHEWAVRRARRRAAVLSPA
jgi:hypothetical protein